MHRYIAKIDIVQPRFLSYLLGTHQCFKSCRFMVQHLIVRMKGTQMPRYMPAEFIGNESRHLLQIFVTVILSRDDQSSHLDPDTLTDHSSKCIFHLFKSAFEDFLVVGIVPALQVDVGSIEPARHIFNDLFGLETVAYEDIFQSPLFGDHTDIFGIGVEDGGLIVGVGDGSGTMLECKVHHPLG